MSSVRSTVGKAIVIGAAATGLVLALGRLTAFKDFERYAYDFTVIHVGLSPPSSQIVLVDFDEDTFQRIRRYPIPRSVIAERIKRIGAAKPRVIGVDIFLSETRRPEEDKAMQEALTSAQI
jgi:adenylate cyclase